MQLRKVHLLPTYICHISIEHFMQQHTVDNMFFLGEATSRCQFLIEWKFDTTLVVTFKKLTCNTACEILHGFIG
jgi:hypothetical protein